MRWISTESAKTGVAEGWKARSAIEQRARYSPGISRNQVVVQMTRAGYLTVAYLALPHAGPTAGSFG